MSRHRIVSQRALGFSSRNISHNPVCGTTPLNRRVSTPRNETVHRVHAVDSSQFRCLYQAPSSMEDSPYRKMDRSGFSTVSSSSTSPGKLEYPDSPELTTSELQQLTMKHARQNKPIQAQMAVEKLIKAETSDKVESTPEELAIVLASVVDCWLNYQTAQMEKLREAAAGNEAINLQHAYLEEILYAAECASDLVENMTQTSPHHVLASLKAWANVCVAANAAGCTKLDWIRGIPQRSQYIFATNESSQSLEAVNQVLRAWAYSGEHLRGTMAEQFFQDYLSTGDASRLMSPNGDSYRNIIRAWCWSAERRCAFTATGHFMRMMRLLEIGREDMEPTLDDYRILFKAWTKAEDKTAPSKAHTVLEIADSVYRKGLTQNRPDIVCYQDALFTMAQRVNVPDVGDLVDKTLLEMKKERMMIPDTLCYRAAIRAWKNMVTAREYHDKEGAIQRSFDLLQEMIQAFHRTTVVTVKPTTEDFNTVLEALSESKSARASKQAMALLDIMEAAGKTEGMGEANPDANSFRHIFNVWRSSKKLERVDQAVQALERFKARMPAIRETSSERAIIQAFSAFISVCANAAGKEESLNAALFARAMKTVDDLKNLDMAPDASTYSALLEASGRLLSSESGDRQRALENIFLRACHDGHVDQSVLEQFKASASSYLYAKLVVAESQEVDNQKVVPKAWTRNVTGHLVNSRGGRKVLPLTIDGQFTIPRAATEYKMRKLRRQANKRMLQGGRL